MLSTLAASPASPSFVPPICLTELAASLRARYRHHVRIVLVTFTLFLCSVLYLAFMKQNLFTIGLFAASFFMLLAVATDSLFLVRHADALEDRARFMCWIQRSGRGRRAAFFWIAFLFSIGAVQLFLQAHYGGLERLIRLFGADFASIRSGQYWRYFAGPLFHSGPAHFINNAVLLMFVGTLSLSMLRYESLVVFVAGNIAGVAAQMEFGSAAFDSFVGISPGVFALFGCVVASGWAEPRRWPAGFAMLCGWLAVASLAMSQILANNAATASHLAGLFVGIALTFMMHCVRRAGRDGEVD